MLEQLRRSRWTSHGLPAVAVAFWMSNAVQAADAGLRRPTSRSPAQAAPAPAFDACFDHHGKRFAVSGDLLRGIARVESNMHPSAINNSHVARTGTRDIGLMQINSSLLPKLASYGIGEHQLLDPCTSIEVAAWVLADTLRRHGDTWEGLGAYNAVCTQLRGKACTEARSKYAWAVYRRMDTQRPSTLAQETLGQLSRPLSDQPARAARIDSGIFSLTALALGKASSSEGTP